MSTRLGVILDIIGFLFYTVFKRIQYFLFPEIRTREVKNLNIISDDKAELFKWNKENVGDFYFTWNMILVAFKTRWNDANKTAKLGGPPPNPQMIDVRTGKLVQLIQNQVRPQVLNFGSCTCPPFMASLVEFDKLSEIFSDLADFTTIYTEEAHPTEANDFENFVDIYTHKSLEDRLNAAKEIEPLIGKLKGKLLADKLDNEACKAYGSFPDRLYIIENGKIVYQGGVGPFDYKVSEVEQWLNEYKLKRK